MTKILFIMFQGSGTNLKSWNEYTKSKFLDRLKELGSVYTYQDKIHNLGFYDSGVPPLYKNDYDSDIDIDLSYVKPDTHIKMVYDDIKTKYKNLDEYKFIPMAWSAGGYLALYFAQVYSSQCVHVVLLDPTVITPNNIAKRLKEYNNVIYPITNAKYKKMLQDLKINQTDEDVIKISNINHYIRTLFISKHLKLKLSVPTLSFVNIQKPEGYEYPKDFTDNKRIIEVKTLEKLNPENYKAIIFINKTHYVFDKIQPAKAIIKEIKNIIKNNA